MIAMMPENWSCQQCYSERPESAIGFCPHTSGAGNVADIGLLGEVFEQLPDVEMVEHANDCSAR
jgi:hypothetical protein